MISSLAQATDLYRCHLHHWVLTRLIVVYLMHSGHTISNYYDRSIAAIDLSQVYKVEIQ